MPLSKFLFKACYYIRKGISALYSFALSPHVCLCCGLSSGSLTLCRQCIDAYLVPFVPKEKRCGTCGCEIVSEIDLCTVCRDKPILQSLDGVFPLWPYHLWKKELLFSWKIKNQRLFSAIFAQTAAAALNTYYPGLPVIPVPPRPGKIRKKGWDQIDELVSFLEYFHGIPVLRVLERTENAQQKKLNREQRITHLGHSYRVLKIIPQETLSGGAVIIDDIMTTGVTLETVSRALKEAGVSRVYALTLFYAD